MSYEIIFDRIDLLITICFSFAIILKSADYSMNLKNQEALIRLSFSFTFFAPVFAYISGYDNIVKQITCLSELILILVILGINSLSPTKKVYWITFTVLISLQMSIIYCIAHFYIPNNSTDISSFTTPLIIMGGVLNLFLLRKSPANKNWLFAAIFFMIILNIVSNFPILYQYRPIITLIRLLTYSAFFAYANSKSIVTLKREPTISFDNEIMFPISKTKSREIDSNENEKSKTSQEKVEPEKKVQNLIDFSKIDPLTKALSRETIIEKIKAEASISKQKPFSIIMFDIDNFREINTKLGYDIGDKVLRNISFNAKSCLRSGDSIGRFDNDIFIILLPNTTTLQAKLIADRVKKKIEDSNENKTKISFGISSHPSDSTEVSDLIAIAEINLFKHKKSKKRIGIKN